MVGVVFIIVVGMLMVIDMLIEIREDINYHDELIKTIKERLHD